MNYQHKELAESRWEKMSLCEQMANIGSEVSRALNWKEKGNHSLSMKAVDRALELLDLTAASHNTYARLKEILRTREALVDFFYGENEYSSTESSLRKYFDAFAYYYANKKQHSC